MQHNNDLTMTPEQLAQLQAEADHQTHLKAYMASQQPQDGSAGLYTLFADRNMRLMFVNYLDVKSVKTTQLVSKQFRDAVNKDEQELLYKAAVNQLPQYVCEANWKMIAALINWNPDLIFKKFNINMFGQEMETSVLEYACYMRDRYTKNICKSALRPDQKDQYNKIVLSYSIEARRLKYHDVLGEDGFQVFWELVANWITNNRNHPVSIQDLRNHLVEQTLLMSQENGVYCLQPFYWACAAYLDMLRRNLEGNVLITDDKLATFWQKINGFAKRYFFLPINMRKQIPSHSSSDIDAEMYPLDCRVSHVNEDFDEVMIDPNCDDNPNFIFGEDYSIMFGGKDKVATVAFTGSISFTEHLTDFVICTQLDEAQRIEFSAEQQALQDEIDRQSRLVTTHGLFAEEPVHLGNFPILPFDAELEEELSKKGLGQ